MYVVQKIPIDLTQTEFNIDLPLHTNIFDVQVFENKAYFLTIKLEESEKIRNRRFILSKTDTEFKIEYPVVFNPHGEFSEKETYLTHLKSFFISGNYYNGEDDCEFHMFELKPKATEIYKRENNEQAWSLSTSYWFCN